MLCLFSYCIPRRLTESSGRTSRGTWRHNSGATFKTFLKHEPSSSMGQLKAAGSLCTVTCTASQAAMKKVKGQTAVGADRPTITAASRSATGSGITSCGLGLCAGGHGEGTGGQAAGGEGRPRWHLDRPPRPAAHRQAGLSGAMNPFQAGLCVLGHLGQQLCTLGCAACLPPKQQQQLADMASADATCAGVRRAHEGAEPAARDAGGCAGGPGRPAGGAPGNHPIYLVALPRVRRRRSP